MTREVEFRTWAGSRSERTRPAGSEGALRVALYSPDSYGLGHFRRTRRIAATLARTLPEASVLMLTGCLAADRFPALPRTDLVRLPATTKTTTGSYRSRSLGIDRDSLLRLRAAILEAALTAFEPDLFIVDHAPAGLAGELRPVLEGLRDRNSSTVVALGLRDIIDSGSTVRRAWLADDTYGVLEWAYDEIWVYGRQEVFDPVREYGMTASAAERLRFLGYIGDAAAPRPRSRRRTPLVVAMGGGGEDAHSVLRAAVEARAISSRRFRLVVFPGPLMSFEQKRDLEVRAAEVGRDVLVHHFTERAPAMVADADCVVTMGGYNSMLETIGAGVPSVVVPRVSPREEQLIRAERMTARGWTTFLHPDLLTPEGLLGRILDLCDNGVPARMPSDHLSGLANVAQRSLALLESSLSRETTARRWPTV